MNTLTALLQRLIDQARARYGALPLRDQRRLLLTGLIALPLLVVVLVLEPAWGFAHRARAALDDERALSVLMQAHADEIRALNAARQAKTGHDTSLLALASKTAIDHDLTLQRYEPGVDDKLSVWLSDTDFNKLLEWLDQLVQKYDVQIIRIGLNQSASPGKVEAQLMLQQ